MATFNNARASEFLDKHSLLSDLNAGQWDVIEDKLTVLQTGFETGATSDMYIEHALETFMHSSLDTRKSLNDWIKARPNSAFAHAARGIHYWRVHWHGNRNYPLPESQKALFAPDGFLYQGDELEKARADLKKAISLNPRLGAAHSYLISVEMIDKSQSAKGIAYRKALNVVPDSDAVKWRYFFSLVPQWRGHKTNAILEVKLANFMAKRKGHADAPENFLTYFDGMKYSNRGKRKLALEFFEQATTETTRWYIGYDYADMLIKNKKYDKAIVTAQAVLEKYPQNPQLLSAIARAHCNLENYEAAFEFWKEALTLDPHDPVILDYSAWCRVEWGRKIENGKVQTQATTAKEQYELAFDDMQAATVYTGLARHIRFRQGSILTYRLKRHEDALRHTKFLMTVKPGTTKYMNLHSQVMFGSHSCEFKTFDMKILDKCQSGSCSKYIRNSVNWRASVVRENGWC